MQIADADDRERRARQRREVGHGPDHLLDVERDDRLHRERRELRDPEHDENGAISGCSRISRNCARLETRFSPRGLRSNFSRTKSQVTKNESAVPHAVQKNTVR